MAEDWAADVKKYDPGADDGIIAGIVRYCGIALRNRDSSLVSFTDPAETARVRENFLKKKLALTDSDDVLDRAIAEVGDRMKGDHTKNRVTVYYLLAQAFGMLGLFGKGSADEGPGAGAATAAGAGAAAMGLASLGGSDPAPVVDHTPVAKPARFADTTPPAAAYEEEEEGGGLGWLWWLLLGLGLLALLWWLFFRQPANDSSADAAVNGTATEAAASATTVDALATETDLTVAPAEGTVAIPTGAGVTSELRAGKPVVKVYFDTAKAEVAPAFTGAAGGLKAWLAANPGTSLAVSGYNDSTGNAAVNAELSKDRAQAVQAALVAAGIAEGSVELVKPEDTTAGAGDDAAARRVEVVVR